MITLEELTEKTASAYLDLSEATQAYGEASQEAEVQDRALKKLINRAVADGSISGKNVTERDAAKQALFGEQFDFVDNLRDKQAEARNDLDLARIEVEYVRAMLRIMELTYGTD